eukprot:116852-Chlamydomonas_euryale.AAC.2
MDVHRAALSTLACMPHLLEFDRRGQPRGPSSHDDDVVFQPLPVGPLVAQLRLHAPGRRRLGPRRRARRMCGGADADPAAQARGRRGAPATRRPRRAQQRRSTRSCRYRRHRG